VAELKLVLCPEVKNIIALPPTNTGKLCIKQRIRADKAKPEHYFALLFF